MYSASLDDLQYLGNVSYPRFLRIVMGGGSDLTLLTSSMPTQYVVVNTPTRSG